MKKLLSMTLVLAVLAMAPASALAAGKIGYVDLQKALNLSEEGKAAKMKITTKAKEFETDIEKRQLELKALKDDLEKQAVLLSEDARSAKERDYQQRLKDFQRFTKDRQEELQQLDADYTNRIVEKMLGLIEEVAKKEGYDLIIERGSGGLIYGADSLDLTDKLMAEANARFKKENGN